MQKINLLSEKNILKNLSSFEGGLKYLKDEGRKPWARYSSFDYCFNYFQEFNNKKELASKNNIQNSCLHLAFYLASWGMLRGSSFLLQKSIKFYEPLIEYISEKNDSFWEIDVNNYDQSENIDQLIECANKIKEILGEKGKNKVSDTLITKIMLGVFGNVPAFDSYFKIGSGLNTFNKHSLDQLSSFYKNENYAGIISKEANKIKTFQYHTDCKEERLYTRAKIIDMIFFIQGYEKNIK
jgi:hypothetical protein